MSIHGFQSLTLLDYPGLTAATLFLGGCNFRCPFCQNSGLVLQPGREPEIPFDEIFAFLKKRRRVLDGVCITGGEPTLDSGLEALIAPIKELGYRVKLDTNGTHPQVLKSLHQKGLLDFVAMDIKASPEGYARAAGLDKIDLTPIQESIDFLMGDGPDYEFRTTVVRELHRADDFEKIREWIGGCKRYYLQAYKDSGAILKPGCFSSYSLEELEGFRDILHKKIPLVEIRGID